MDREKIIQHWESAIKRTYLKHGMLRDDNSRTLFQVSVTETIEGLNGTNTYINCLVQEKPMNVREVAEYITDNLDDVGRINIQPLLGGN